MLFGPCACSSSALSRRSVLQAGSVGFVSAMVATLVGSQHVAHAEPLGAATPEIDRLVIQIVTDSQTNQYLPSQKRDGLTIEPRSRADLSPDKPPRAVLTGEWGLSMHARSQHGAEVRNVLIDFGYTPETLLNNMSILKIDPAEIDAMVLSHGHYDHFGGMVGFLAANKGKLKGGLPFFVGGEDCFCARELNGGDYGALDRAAILDANLALMLAEGPAVIAGHGFTTGKIAQTGFEKPPRPSNEKIGIVNGVGCFPNKVSPSKNTGAFIPDDFEHEIATNYLLKGRGLVVLTSCSHRGVINTIRQAQAASGVQKVHAVIGGFHLAPIQSEDYIRETVAGLKEIDPDYIVAGHCSGEMFYDLARAEMPGKIIHSNVGTRFVFDA